MFPTVIWFMFQYFFNFIFNAHYYLATKSWVVLLCSASHSGRDIFRALSCSDRQNAGLMGKPCMSLPDVKMFLVDSFLVCGRVRGCWNT